MKLNFKKCETINEIRRRKLNRIEKNEEENINIKYDYKLIPETEHEYKFHVENFHMFCLCVVKEMFNKYEDSNYECIKNFNIEHIDESLNAVMSEIYNKIEKNNN